MELKQTMKKGLELIKEIDNKKPGFGQLCFWWLGQHSFIVKTGNTVFYLDPFLSYHPDRLVSPLLEPVQVTNADIITGSHDHGDHIDHSAIPEMMATSTNSLFIVPNAAWPGLKDIGIETSRIRKLDDEEVLIEGDVKITTIKAAHEFFDHDEILGYPYLGYVIETKGVTFYHAGDTCVYDGLASRLRTWEFTAAFLPINGRDARRLWSGIIGNMTYQEAVDLAGTIKPHLTVPSHYDMFALNGEDPSLFADYMDVKFPDLDYWIGAHGVGIDIDDTI